MKELIETCLVEPDGSVQLHSAKVIIPTDTNPRIFLPGFPRLVESPTFFLENSRIWKVLENHFGPGKDWKLNLKVLESSGKISLKVMHFSDGSNGKQAAIA